MSAWLFASTHFFFFFLSIFLRIRGGKGVSKKETVLQGVESLFENNSLRPREAYSIEMSLGFVNVGFVFLRIMVNTPSSYFAFEDSLTTVSGRGMVRSI